MSSISQSLKTQRHLAAALAGAGQSMERLGSGLRINRAADDAAGLAISNSLIADSRVFTQAVRNVNDGASLLNIAEGALRELGSIADRQMELAEQAANGVYSSRQRIALDKEANALVDEYNRIIQGTRYNNLGLLDGSLKEGIRFQMGYGVQGSLLVTLGKEMASSGDGTFKAAATIFFNSGSYGVNVTDLNGDGAQDMAVADNWNNQAGVYLGNGDGTFKAVRYFSVGAAPAGITSGDFNGDGIKDLATSDTNSISVMLGNGDGTYRARTSLTGLTGGFELVAQDLNGDGRDDIVGTNSSSNSLAVFIGLGNGSFSAMTTYRVGNDPLSVVTDDINNDGIVDLVAGSLSNEISVLLGNGDGTFRSKISLDAVNSVYRTRTGDFNGDGKADIAATAIDGAVKVFRGNGDGTFAAARSYATSAFPNGIAISDINGDTFEDIITGDESDKQNSVLLGNGDGTFRARVSYAVGFNALPRDLKLSDLNNDGALDIVNIPEGGHITVLLGNSGRSGVIPRLDLTTQPLARESLTKIANTRERVGRELGAIGAFQSRLAASARSIFVANENYKAADSRIRDADVAEETSQLIRQNILQQSASAILAQGSRSAEIVLSLIAG